MDPKASVLPTTPQRVTTTTQGAAERRDMRISVLADRDGLQHFIDSLRLSSDIIISDGAGCPVWFNLLTRTLCIMQKEVADIIGRLQLRIYLAPFVA